MKYNVNQLRDIIEAKAIKIANEESIVEHIIYDSRKISYPRESVFVALKGNSDGHNYLNDAYNKGIRNFIISKDVLAKEDCNILLVDDVLASVQKLAIYHRQQHNIQSIGITGSNGKTIIKEWLTDLLAEDYNVVKSPKSFNSQLGVPLSVIQIKKEHEIGVFEAGISEKNEMASLATIIRPDIGIISNLGDAHAAGFKSKEEKLAEKLNLFIDSSVIIYNRDNELIHGAIESRYGDKHLFSWGEHSDSSIKILDEYADKESQYVKLMYRDEIFTFNVPYRDTASRENLLHVISVAIFLEIDLNKINKKIKNFSAVPLRFEIESGRNNSFLINDSYSIDLASFKIALEHLEKQAEDRRRVIIITDFDHQVDKTNIINQTASLIKEKEIDLVITVGYWIDQIKKQLDKNTKTHHYTSTDQLLHEILSLEFDNSVILIKGARRFGLERVYKKLSAQLHQTILEINLTRVAANISEYKSLLRPDTKMMAVIKASAYGSGASELAKHILRHGIDYLAVALADEGVELRKAGVSNPILIFNVQDSGIDLLWEYNLEPEIYSLNQLKRINAEANRRKEEIKIHIKLDTGMRRLGFLREQLSELCQIIKSNEWIKVATIFSHLAASEDQQNDSFTNTQFEEFEDMNTRIEHLLNSRFPRHILNSSGIIRFPEHQYEMVRIGLGMYGINDVITDDVKLQKVHCLKTRILQIKSLKRGEATGYGRDAVAQSNMTIAIIGIGYADGFFRNSGTKHHYVLIRGKKALILGKVCMDVTIVDISKIPDVREGDEAIIFGEKPKIEALARVNNTIPYEILSRISKRVKRIYLEE